MLLRLGYPLTGDKRETTIAVVIAVAIIIQTTQNAQALHRTNGLTDEQLKTGLATNPDVKAVKAALNALNPVGDNLITACGGVSDILKDGSEQGTFIGKLTENIMTICDHNTLWMKGMCQTHFDMFSWCGKSGSLQVYLEDRNLVDSPPERTYLNADGSIRESVTNTDLPPK
jgi:hypothetical protein